MKHNVKVNFKLKEDLFIFKQKIHLIKRRDLVNLIEKYTHI